MSMNNQEEVEKVAEEIAVAFDFRGTPAAMKRGADVVRRVLAEKDAEIQRRSDTARETCRQAWTDAHEANARAERAEVDLAALRAENERRKEERAEVCRILGLDPQEVGTLVGHVARLREAGKDRGLIDRLHGHYCTVHQSTNGAVSPRLWFVTIYAGVAYQGQGETFAAAASAALTKLDAARARQEGAT